MAPTNRTPEQSQPDGVLKFALGAGVTWVMILFAVLAFKPTQRWLTQSNTEQHHVAAFYEDSQQTLEWLQQMQVQELIGKRVLFKEREFSSTRFMAVELKVLEVSPSGFWVKLMALDGRKYWREVRVCQIIEQLTDLEPAPRSK
jgi:enterochelin esterase-like enzyme